jgi:hypothetical protein
MLPFESKKQINTLAEKSAQVASIRGLMSASYKQLTDPKVSEAQKVTIGREMLKTINSPLGADAVGAEEAKRLSSFLEFKLANFTEPGSFIGRDLDQFNVQIGNNINKMNSVLTQNNKIIEQLKRGGALTGDAQIDTNSSGGPGWLVNEAQAAVPLRPIKQMTVEEMRKELGEGD